MERIASLLKASVIQDIPMPKVFIAAIGESAEREGLAIADRLRDKDIWVELGYSGNSLKSQMRRADRLSSKYVLIIGDDEIASGKLKWKCLSDKSRANSYHRSIGFVSQNELFLGRREAEHAICHEG
jgi:histidyl-tRNA synthetase